MRPLIAAIGEEFAQERIQTEQSRENHNPTVAILNVGGMNHGLKQEAYGIDEDVTLLAFDLLARVDRSFVSELAENGDCVAIVRAITRLGSSLGIRTTAEASKRKNNSNCCATRAAPKCKAIYSAGQCPRAKSRHS